VVRFDIIRNSKYGVPTRRCDVEAFAKENKGRNIIVEINITGVGSAFADYLEGEGFWVARFQPMLGKRPA
jgi:hypothetical protein